MPFPIYNREVSMGFLEGIFDDDNTLLIIVILLVVFLLLKDDGCGDNIFDKFNLGDNWLLILIVILCLCGDGFDIF
ncbi:hypothetical protein [Alkalibaculum bacchi]|nr:hypothetical protein [Alkalibaculum bacchi]